VKVVFDTKVLIAAFVADGLCSRLLARARKGHFQLFACPCIFTEFRRILAKKLKASPEEVKQALEILSEALAGEVTPHEEVQDVCRDKDDDKMLACARAAGAEADSALSDDDAPGGI
jgi:putative PIN family toxin of toxin-antitoxin system